MHRLEIKTKFVTRLLAAAAIVLLGLLDVAWLQLLAELLLVEEQGIADPAQPCEDVVVVVHVRHVPANTKADIPPSN